jgi:hypothetical protein
VKGIYEMTKSILIIFCVCLFSSFPNFAQDSTHTTVVIMPFQHYGVDSVYTETAESIFTIEYKKLSRLKIIEKKYVHAYLQNQDCSEYDCAIETGNHFNASQVFGCKLSPLGDKIIVQYFLLELPEGDEIIIDQITSLTIEDLETVMKRVAKSVAEYRQIAKGARVGNITQSESKKMLKKSSNKNIGLSFGYLYPQNGYNNVDKSFTLDLRIEYELEKYAVGMLLGARKGFAMNVYTSYLFTQTDVSPFIGGAFGFHWVSHDINYLYPENKKNEDGFEFTARSGVRLFRTYNFQILINLEYIYTLNDYDDQAILFTIGIL